MPSVGTRRSDTKVLSSLKRTTPGRSPIERHHACPPQGVHSTPRNSCTTWRLNSIECVRCLAMGFLLESPVQLADSQGPYLSTSKGALHNWGQFEPLDHFVLG